MRKALIAAALVALAACAQQMAPAPAAAVPQPKPFQPPQSWGLYASDRDTGAGNWQLTQLDAATLLDRHPWLTGDGFAIASRDGSTLAELDYSGQPVAVRIIDARTALQRTTIHIADGASPVLSIDGSRLLVLNSQGNLWQVFDTSTGTALGRLQDDTNPCCGALDFYFDPTGRFLYRGLVPGSGASASGPGTPVLVQYDLEAGREIRRLTLTGVQAGLWQGPRVIGTEHVSTELIPGFALSPDGSRVSVLYADASRLLTVDTATLKVVADRPVVASGPVANGFGLAPLDAEAKYMEGVQWQIAYAPDGRYLVAWATQTMVDNVGNFSQRGLGVRLIDALTGAVMAEAPNLEVDNLFYAPDGSALYATSVLPNAHMVLTRIDATNLAVAATRDFTDTRTILALAR